MFKKTAFLLLIVSVCCFSLSASSLNPLTDVSTVLDEPGDPAQRIIAKFSQWTTLSQAQQDQIISMSSELTWTGLTRAEFKQQRRNLVQSVFTEILSADQKTEVKNNKG